MKYAMFAVILAVSLIAGAAARPLGDHAEKGKLRVGILKERPPLAFEENGKLSGLGVELTRDIGRQMKRDVVLIQGRSVELYALLEQGEIDVAVCLPRLAGAYSNLRFIPTGLSVNRRILVTESGMDIRSEQDFQGRHLVFIETDRQYADLARKAGAEVFFVRDIPSALAALEKHEADAYVAGMGEVAASLAWKDGLNIALKGGSLERTELYLATEEKNLALSSRLAEILTELEQKGTLTELREIWLGLPLWEKGFWERYGERIAYWGMALGVCIALIIGWNISLRRRVSIATANLRASEARYRELTEASPDAVMLLNGTGEILYANPGARELLSHDESFWNGHPEGLKCRLEELARETLTGHGGRCEHVLQEQSNGTRHFEILSFSATLDGEGTPGVCTLWRDISSRRLLEQELTRADRMSVIGRMAAGVAHEINNPLGVIMANAEYLAEKHVGGAQVEAILAHGERAEASIRRLLNLAVMPEVRWESVNLTGLVRECILFLQPRLRKIKVTLRLPEWLPVRGEKGMLEQVILNLVINALDSMKDVGHLDISGELLERTGIVRLGVTDDGPGIDGDNAERVFELFYSTKGGQGFGIGLYVARNIAEMHRGCLRAESRPGETRFTLDLPLPEQELRQTENRSQPSCGKACGG
mgnify:CR=1 FL=1